MEIEVFDGDAVEQRQVGENTYFEQRAYMHQEGARFPVEFKLQLDSKNPGYKPGRYRLNDDAFQINRYGNLELNRYRILLQPITAAVRKATG
jgi:hypothetical protein